MKSLNVNIFSVLTISTGILYSLLMYNISIDWYLIPLFLCGVMSLQMIIKSALSGESYQNVYLIVWIVFLINSYIAPLIHFSHDFWVNYLPFCPTDWNDYALLTSSFYLVGMLIFYAILTPPTIVSPCKNEWNEKSSAPYIIIFLFIISLLAQLYIYAKMGGIAGYIANYTEGGEGFTGMGKFFIFSELGPSLFLIYLVVRNRGRAVSGKQVFFFLVILLLMALFFGGLRGSRSNTLFTLIQGILTIHIMLYRFNLKHVVLFVTFFFLFMYVGRLYKDQGEKIVDLKNAIETRQSLTHGGLSQEETVIVGDLSRYGINTYEICRLIDNSNYDLKWGQTYLWGTLTFIPLGSHIINSLDIKSRSESAQELMYGRNSFRTNSRIFGLLGEWLLNFGIYTFFIPYILMGLIIKQIRMITLKIAQSPNDIRMLMIPVFMVFIPTLILSDSSNVIFFCMKRVLLFYIILRLISNKAIA